MKALLVAASSAALLSIGAAQAAVLDFGTYAETDAGKIANGLPTSVAEVGGVADGTVINFGTLNVEFSATNGPDDAYAYFDSRSSGKPAGLGVCKVLTASKQCVPSSDDNALGSETATLKFLSGTAPVSVTIGGFQFRTAQHNVLNGTVQVAINGGAFVTMTTADLAQTSVLTGVSQIAFRQGSEEFYVEAFTSDDSSINQVPVPAAALLFAPVLAAVARRRRR